MSDASVALGELMADRLGTIEPNRFPDEPFDLYSIPAYDSRVPEFAIGSSIGSAKQVVSPGDVLLSKIVPHIRRAWIVGPASGRRTIASGEWIVFRSDRLEPRYLRHVLLGDAFHKQFMQTVAGVGGSLLRARPSQVANIRIPLPAQSEQRRIASILDQADALRAKRQEASAQLDSLTQSIFLEMFGDPVSNSMRWPNSSVLGDVAEIVSGITKGRRLTGSTTRPVPYMAVANVQDKHLNLSAVKQIEATAEEIERYRLRCDDLLLTEGGDPDKLGRGTLWQDELPECIHQNHIFRVRVTAEDIHPLFLNWLVGSERGKKYFLRSAKQTTGIASINMTQLRGFPLLVPPISLQREFAKRSEQVASFRKQLTRALEETHSLFESLQHSAFRGEL
ncbi:MAG: restriction endonuclease subunit S [Rhizobacter sp.]|nr:restriction endonuclease subunit S [Rhizobacter sp.]